MAAFPNPTESQLKLINTFTPVPIQAKEVVVVSFIGTDNLLNRGMGKWGLRELDKLAELLPGLPLTLDHDWDEVSKVQGLVFDARILLSEQAPESVIDSAGNRIWNEAIVAKEGYRFLEFDAAIPVEAPILSSLRLGLIGKISLGGFTYEDIVCPICQVPFDNDKCPHFIPDSYTSRSPLVAPYYERSGVFDLGEASIVLIPNYAGTGTKKVL